MRLTKKELQKIADSLRITLEPGVEKDLLSKYSDHVTDDEGRIFEYTEQDIYEQVRKILC